MKVHFTTLGCPKNQVDSELMLGMLTRAGHEIAEAAAHLGGVDRAALERLESPLNVREFGFLALEA